MTEAFAIATVRLAGGGRIGLCRMPGRSGDLSKDGAVIRAWTPTAAVTLTTTDELDRHGASGLSVLLAEAGINHHHFSIVDFGAPEDDAAWPLLAARLHTALDAGGGVLLHCLGGCGRSGMIALRLMIERGEAPDPALARLRAVRPCAVETEGQMAWAKAGAASA
jgi:protein-tyrosine phosphatase